jgi:two-component system response regulator YesN
MKVLLVEDETLVRRFIKSLIDWEANGFMIAGEASNGEEAWSILEKHPIDIVLTDIRMPALNGFELIKRIREKQLPCEVVILSSYDDYEYVRTALKLQVSDYVHKATISEQELLDTLKQAKGDWLQRQEQLLYDQSVNQSTLSRRSVVASKLLTMALDGITDRSYLELMSGSLAVWKESFHAALVGQSEHAMDIEQAEGDLIMLSYGGDWVIAGQHGVKEFILKQKLEQTSVTSRSPVTLQEWPSVYASLKRELEERMDKQEQARAFHVSVREALLYIEEHYMDELTLEVMSEQVHVSTAYFSRLFQKETKQTFTDYLTHTRIGRAKLLLLQTDLPVYDIAERVGYRNSRYFLKLFKETVGLTPTVFRESEAR